MEQREHWLDVSHHGNDPYCNTVSVKIFDVRLCACPNAANTVEVGSFTELVAVVHFWMSAYSSRVGRSPAALTKIALFQTRYKL